ncbi:5-methyltetrahydrofolate--homocysteine methyltransferase [Clostridium sp. LBM24168]
MKVVTDFIFKLNKSQTINSLLAYDQLVDKNELPGLYDSLLPTLYDVVHPYGIFNIEKITVFPAADKYEYIIPCIITIGETIDEKINKYFYLKKLSEGIMLNSMANSYLFEISYQLFEKIYMETSRLHIGLSSRLTPGVHKLPMEYQKFILESLNNSKNPNIAITENYMLKPLHSMAYLYGADKKIPLNKNDHDCSKCPSRKSCIMRKDLI